MKWFSWLIILSFSASIVSAGMCEEESIPELLPCQMTTPTIQCDDYNYSVYSSSGSIIQNGNLTLLNDSVYYFNYSVEESGVIVLCDGSSREFYVGGEKMFINYLFLGLLFVLFLFWIGFAYETLFIYGGMISSLLFGLTLLTGVYNNYFLYIVSLVLLLLGIGYIYQEKRARDREQEPDAMRRKWLE